MLCVCAYQYAVMLETCCISFSVIDMLDGTARGVCVVEGGGGGGGQWTYFKFCLYSKRFDL